MASVFSQFGQWLRSPAGRQYFFSTHFWGPIANWGLPVAAVLDMSKDEKLISGPMTGAMGIYSATFMRFAWRVQPRNYLLLACHTINVASQSVQGGRFINYWYMGGRERRLLEKPEEKDAAVPPTTPASPASP